MTYNVFGGTLNPTLLLLTLAIHTELFLCVVTYSTVLELLQAVCLSLTTWLFIVCRVVC